MLKKLLTAFVLFGGALLYGQNDQANLEKYWKFRNSFREKFVKIANEPGGSLPIGSINPNGCTPGADVYWQGSYASMHWGDGMIRQGHYLQLLATEYKLLKNNNKDVTGVLNELYFALQAINRCDLNAERAEQDFYHLTLEPDLNGFYLREDVPEDFGKKYWGETKLKPRGIDAASYYNDRTDKVGARSNTEGNIPSLDQISSLMAGLLVVHKLVDNHYVQPTPQDELMQTDIEVQAITTRLVSHMAYNNWYMLQVNGWPVSNGGGDVILMAYPILEAAYEITGNYTFPTKIRRRMYFGYANLIQPCLTGYGMDVGPDQQASKCHKLENENALALLTPVSGVFSAYIPQRSAYNKLKDETFLEWQSKGDLDYEVKDFALLWHFHLAESAPEAFRQGKTVTDFLQSDVGLSWFADFLPNMKEYNKTIIYNLGIASGHWSRSAAKKWADETGNYPNELINGILRNEVPLTSRDEIREYLNSLSTEGAFHIRGSDSELANSRVDYYKSGWKIEYKWNHTSNDDFDVYEGLYNNLDYMLMHNLYYLAYGDQPTLPKFQEEVNCDCANPVLTKDSPGIEMSHERHYTENSITSASGRFPFLEPCNADVFEQFHSQLYGSFIIKNHFDSYKDLKIFDTKIQMADCIINWGADVHVQTNFVVCTNKFLQIRPGSKFDIEYGTTTLKKGAVMDIGGDVRVWDNTTINVLDGATIRIRNGGTLIFEQNCTLNISPNAKIEYYGGGKIVQKGHNSVLNLEGEILLMDECTFTIEQWNPAICGQLNIIGTPRFNANTVNSKIELRGLGKNVPYITLVDNAILKIDAVGISSVLIINSQVEMKNNSAITILPKFQMYASSLISSTENQGITVLSRSSFFATKVKNVMLFANLGIKNAGILELKGGCEFSNDNHNYGGEFSALVTVDGQGYSVNEANFISVNLTSILSTNLVLPSTILNASFINPVKISGSTGVEENSLVELNVRNSNFNGLGAAVAKTRGKVTLGCNTFNSEIGIVGRLGTLVNLSAEDHAGYNVFNTTSSAIYLNQADLNLKKGYNQFSATSNFYIQGTTFNTLNGGVMSINASNNQWTTSNGTPLPTKFNLKKNVNDVLKYTVTDNSPTYLPKCGTFDGTAPTTPSTTTSNNSSKSTFFVPLISFYGDTVLIDSAFIRAMKNMEFYNDEGNDLEAIRDLNELFKNNLDKSNIQHAFYMNFAIKLMKTSLENAVRNNKIEGHQADKSYDEYVQMYANALMKLTDETIDLNNYKNQYNLELNKAQLFRLIKKSDIGFNILNELESCGLDSVEQAELNYWKKQFEIDLKVREIGVSAIDSTIIVDTTEYKIPTVISINQFHFGAEIQDMNNITYPNCIYFEKSAIAGVSTLNAENDVQVYPNPAKDQVHIKIASHIQSSNYRLVLTTNDGRTVHDSNYRSASNSIENVNVSNCKEGLYHYQIILSTGEIKTGRFIINR